MKSLFINACVEMVNNEKVDVIICLLQKHHRYIELRKAKHDKKLLVEVCKEIENADAIQIMLRLKSIEVIRELCVITELKYSREVKSND